MQQISHRSAALSVAGIFLSLSIIAAVLSCALWDFQMHSRRDNLLYSGGVLISSLLNVLISAALVQGVRFNMPHLLTPYIICASFHLSISTAGSAFLFLTTVHDYQMHGSTVSSTVSLLAICICLSLFWIGSLGIVWQQRKEARKCSGQRLLLVDSEI